MPLLAVEIGVFMLVDQRKNGAGVVQLCKDLFGSTRHIRILTPP